MGVYKTPTFFPFLLSLSIGWAQGFRVKETLEIIGLFPWKYRSVIHYINNLTNPTVNLRYSTVLYNYEVH